MQPLPTEYEAALDQVFTRKIKNASLLTADEAFTDNRASGDKYVIAPDFASNKDLPYP